MGLPHVCNQFTACLYCISSCLFMMLSSDNVDTSGPELFGLLLIEPSSPSLLNSGRYSSFSSSCSFSLAESDGVRCLCSASGFALLLEWCISFSGSICDCLSSFAVSLFKRCSSTDPSSKVECLSIRARAILNANTTLALYLVFAPLNVFSATFSLSVVLFLTSSKTSICCAMS